MHPIQLPEHLWRALSAMAADTGVETDALVRLAVFGWLRLNGYVVPSALSGLPPEAPLAPLAAHPAPALAAPLPPPPAPAPPPEPLAQVMARLEEEEDADVQAPVRVRPPWPAEPPGATPVPLEQPGPALPGADAPSDELPGAGAEVEAPTGVGPRVPVVDQPEFEPSTQLLQGHPLAAYIEREGHERVRVVGDRFVLGRGPQCDLIIDSPRVSREHAAVVRQGMSYLVEDLGSSNGTFVGDERVTRQELQSGDVLRLGNEVMLVVIRAAEPSVG